MRNFTTILIGLLLNIAAYGQYRAIDGTNNHPNDLGSTGAPLFRLTENAYADGISALAGADRKNPRVISNEIFSQGDRIDNNLNLSDYVWAFGQFIDHDISFVAENHTEDASIEVIEEESTFDVGDNIFMFRSQATPGTGTDIDNPREYSNGITSFLDASMIYGSDMERADWLRDASSDKGKLKVSDGNLLPWNTDTGEIGGSTSSASIPEMDNPQLYTNKHFVAGDTRANENPLLIALHTIFVREHNRLCDQLAEEHPDWLSNKLYEEARKRVGAYIQAITYYEWLPSQGVVLPSYNGYSSEVDPSIFNVFSAAAFRMGHTLINSSIIRMEDDGGQMASGNVDLRNAYFNPTLINIVGGVEPYLKGMATNLQQDFDCKMIDDLRNFLFLNPNSGGGLDLAAININRGRERGLPDYNTIRYNFGLPRLNEFIGITGDAQSAQFLEDTYGDIDNIDPWVGMLAEKHESDALVGKLVMTILEKQFQVLRDGDRFYFENDAVLSAEEIHEIKNTKLHDIIMRNTNISLMQDEVFEAMPHEEIPNGADILPLHLEASVYPNPTDGMIAIKFYLEVEETVKMSIYNTDGQLLMKQSYDGIIGDNFLDFQLDTDYPRGIYNIKLESTLGFKILRVLKR